MYQQWGRALQAPTGPKDGKGTSALNLKALPDLYARWAELSGWRSFVREERDRDWLQGEARVRILAKAPDMATLDKALASHTLLQIAPAYHQKIPGGQKRSLFFTATLARKDLPRLSKELNLRWELAVPLRDARSVAEGSAHGYFAQSVDQAAFSKPTVFEWAASKAKRHAATPKLGDTIAVIDFGCPFLNSAYRDSRPGRTGTRIKALWDQGSNSPTAPKPGSVWAAVHAFEHGRQLDSASLSAMYERLHSGLGVTCTDEQRAYRGLDYLIAYDDPRRRVWYATHGSHVLETAGGTIDPLTGAPDSGASNADLLFVQLPALTAADSSGGSLSAHLLDGVRYAMDRCEKDSRLVVNISYGTFAGPHDGSSLIEQAFDELLEARDKNFAIVLGAGNAREAQCHARRLASAKKPAKLRLKLSEGATSDTFLECWYTPTPAATLKLRTRTAEGDWSDWVRPGEWQTLRDSVRGQALAAVLHETSVSNGERAMALLAFAPTANPADDDGALLEPGVWDIELACDVPGSEDAGIVVDVWVERDDPNYLRNVEQSHLLDLSLDDHDDCLSNLATGRHTLVAGGFRLSSGRVASYSSVGPQRDPRTAGLTLLPLVYAACERDDEQTSIAAAAVRSGERFCMAGTSVAAPVLTRRVFNQLKRGAVSREEWPAVLSDLCRTDEFLRPCN
ncbi:S8 family serine peptidase [Paucibacter sp. APW11]|uniref:S8 family serine peptidase n=1 Tax=Roseateles aquae TaxID=3077235 RepID=A0ABU3PFW2_9BURK|nr:S8 family serine peptidase [Paucibacter sp. APW11]MDT9001042.1 S8 family serine peptidase [Paucibacter sp. APW11]